MGCPRADVAALEDRLLPVSALAEALKGAETRMRPVTCWFVWGDSSVR
jgi:hypothetical protein